MDINIALKIATLFVVLVGVPKIIFELTLGRKPRLREEYNFAKDFFSTQNNEELHPFALEKGYQAITGNTSIKLKEAAYILSLENPVESMKSYTLGQKYIAELLDNDKLNFKDKYIRTWVRLIRKGFYLALYIIFVFFALSPLFFTTTAMLLLLTFPFFGFYAAIFLRAMSKIQESEKLIKNQKKRNVTVNKNSSII